jgi:hypothetical protein
MRDEWTEDNPDTAGPPPVDFSMGALEGSAAQFAEGLRSAPAPTDEERAQEFAKLVRLHAPTVDFANAVLEEGWHWGDEAVVVRRAGRVHVIAYRQVVGVRYDTTGDMFITISGLLDPFIVRGTHEMFERLVGEIAYAWETT